MLKKLILILAIAIGASAASAKLPLDKYTIKRENLPETARTMLSEHFPKAKVSMIKVDHHLLRKTDYDVKLTNGTKIEFSNKGEWTSIDCKKGSVPEALVPQAIRTNVAKRCGDVKIVKISRSLAYYTVGISSGKTLKYDKLGIYQGELTDREAEAENGEESEESESEEVGES